jgi:hypothetical protein
MTTFEISIEFSPRHFWALLPAINLNFISGELEFEFLCFGIYIRKQQKFDEKKFWININKNDDK